jgi:hypothetical protein
MLVEFAGHFIWEVGNFKNTGLQLNHELLDKSFDLCIVLTQGMTAITVTF